MIIHARALNIQGVQFPLGVAPRVCWAPSPTFVEVVTPGAAAYSQ